MSSGVGTNVQISDKLSEISSQKQGKSPQVRIQLPLVETATQTDSPPPYPGHLIYQTHRQTPDPSPAAHHGFYIYGNEASVPLNSQVSHDPLESRMSSTHDHMDNGGINYIVKDIKLSPVRRNKSELSSYLIALRPWSFTASITPVALGSCLAYKFQGVFDIYIFFTTIFTALCVHAAGNLVNTYFDFVRGIDTKKSDDRTLVDSILQPNDVATLGAVFYVAGCFGFMLLYFLSAAKLEHLALIYFCGLSSSFFYTGGLGLKYIAMGDILIVLTFGPLTVVFSHLSQTGQLSLVPMVYALPLALNTEAILHSNNTRDMDTDKQAGVITMAILLGKTGSYCLFCFLLFGPYLLFITVGVHYSPWMLLPAASILLVFRLEKDFRRGNLTFMPHKVAQLNFIMGVLYTIAVYLANPQSLPSMTPLSS